MENKTGKPKYNPDGTFIRLDEVKSGKTVDIFPSRGGIFAQETVKVLEVTETRQPGNPLVKTNKGLYGGGTSAKFR